MQIDNEIDCFPRYNFTITFFSAEYNSAET